MERAPAIALLLRITVLVALLAMVIPLHGEAVAVPPARVGGAEASLAVEPESGTQGGQLPGPEPNLQNSFAPEEYEAPWTWWLGVILTAVTVLLIVVFGLAYYVLIHRPRQRVLQP